MKIDDFDKKILGILQSNCKISNAALARKIGLTPPAVLERVKKLQLSGLILGFRAILDKNKLGRSLTCFSALHLEHHNRKKVFELVENNLKKLKEVEEIHLITGRHDYLIKVNLRNVDELKEFIVEKLTKIEYINRVETFLSVKSYINTNLDLNDEEEKKRGKGRKI